jgi:2-phosphosulfolactate phosphatase
VAVNSSGGEDALGAGAVIAALNRIRPGMPASPEARAVITMYSSTPDVAEAVSGCASAVELQAGGYGQDVDVTLEADSSDVVPVLSDRAFRRTTN